MTSAVRDARAVQIGAISYPVLLPRLSDPRLHLAAVIVSLQVLGQTALRFELSITQILVSVGTCGLLEFAIVAYRDRTLAWPASALLTGNGVAFLFRVPGTESGDWWSWRGAHLFAAVAALSILAKHLVRDRGAHVFNPSNLGLTVAFLILGPRLANPQDLWWGPLSAGIVLTLAIIAIGAVAVTTRQGLAGLALAFWSVFAAGIAILAVAGNAMTARWHFGPIEGVRYWTTFVTSPEILVFTFFMITDPRTVPEGSRGRLMFGAGVGALAVALVAPQRTEFAAKVAVLAALTIASASLPVLRRVMPRVRASKPWFRPSPAGQLASWSIALVVGAALLPIAGNDLAGRFESAGGAGRSPVRDAAAGSIGAPPEVVIDETVRKVDLTMDENAATVLVTDLLVDLALVEAAAQQGDESLLDLASTGSARAALGSALGGGPPLVVDPSLARIEIARSPANPQAPPRIGVRLIGVTSPVDPSVQDPLFVLDGTAGDRRIVDVVG